MAVAKTSQPMLQSVSSPVENQPMLSEFFPVSSKLFLSDLTIPCDIFRRSGERFILVARKGLFVTRDVRLFFLETTKDMLFARKEDEATYSSSLLEQIQTAAKTSGSDLIQRSHNIYDSCRELLRQSFADPRASFMQTVSTAVESVVQVILSEQSLTMCLLQLRSHDSETYTHSTNAALLGIAFAKRCANLSRDELVLLGTGLFLHDVGKCQIPLEIINKPGKLTAAERLIIEAHPRFGAEILKAQGLHDSAIQAIALQHHERDDGKGYPDCLTRESIHPLARIARVTDVYEALTSDRPYRKRMSPFEALMLMRDTVCNDIDRQMFEDFVRMFER